MKKHHTIGLLSVLGMIGVILIPTHSMSSEEHPTNGHAASSSSGPRRLVLATERSNPVGRRRGPLSADEVLDIAAEKAAKGWKEDDQARLEAELAAVGDDPDARQRVVENDKARKRALLQFVRDLKASRQERAQIKISAVNP